MSKNIDRLEEFWVQHESDIPTQTDIDEQKRQLREDMILNLEEAIHYGNITREEALEYFLAYCQTLGVEPM